MIYLSTIRCLKIIFIFINITIYIYIYNRVVIREGPGKTPGVSSFTGSGQRGKVLLRVRVRISRGRPVGPVYRGNNVF